MQIIPPDIPPIKTELTKEDEAWLKGFKVGYCLAKNYADRQSSPSDRLLSLILRHLLSAIRALKKWYNKVKTR